MLPPTVARNFVFLFNEKYIEYATVLSYLAEVKNFRLPFPVTVLSLYIHIPSR